MILISKHIVPKGYSGITVFPFIFLKVPGSKESATLLNHEKIHLRQQMELLVIPFFVIYGVEFLVRWMRYKQWNLAYRNISFEREAYEHENDLNYVNSRKFWQFLKYYTTKKQPF